jgi:hypothetical protein
MTDPVGHLVIIGAGEAGQAADYRACAFRMSMADRRWTPPACSGECSFSKMATAFARVAPTSGPALTPLGSGGRPSIPGGPAASAHPDRRRRPDVRLSSPNAGRLRARTRARAPAGCYGAPDRIRARTNHLHDSDRGSWRLGSSGEAVGMRDGYLRGALSQAATRRQVEILAAFVTVGGSIPAAAQLVGIRPSTAKRHLADLRMRLGLSTEQLIYSGRAQGWLLVSSLEPIELREDVTRRRWPRR